MWFVVSDKNMARSLRRSVSPTVSGTWRGVNISNLEYSATPAPEWDNEVRDYRYIASKGFKVVRVPFKWEYLQPTVNGNLDTAYRTKLDDNIGWARDNGLKIILDCHNYGTRDISGTDQILGDGVLTDAHLADLWTKLSTLYKNEPVVLAYALMNEPHDLTIQSVASNYKTTATITTMTQACIDAIRNNGDSKIIIIQRDWWDSLENFLKAWNIGTNPDVWWTDPLNNCWLELHNYFEKAGLTVKSRGDELEAACLWAKARGVPLFIGEFGIPNEGRAELFSAMEYFMKVMDDYKVHGAYWAMGKSQWNVSLGIHPGNSYFEDRPQMEIIIKHL